ncbi:MAG: hypothetical protein Q9183_002817 [Haloplaca sp. 2 TL-2023]
MDRVPQTRWFKALVDNARIATTVVFNGCVRRALLIGIARSPAIPTRLDPRDRLALLGPSRTTKKSNRAEFADLSLRSSTSGRSIFLRLRVAFAPKQEPDERTDQGQDNQPDPDKEPRYLPRTLQTLEAL